ncbi:MAG: hypothetical protein A2Z25_01290 [Planctomycetes bacterium RBG_16_55_9]|nr:MAG: hypothetical protein A2Z25_01290 [Planctomycetes bacterium RBG_16_55_9]
MDYICGKGVDGNHLFWLFLKENLTMKNILMLKFIGIFVLMLMSVPSTLANVTTDLEEAEEFYKTRKYDQAAQGYQNVIHKADPNVAGDIELAFQARRRLPLVYLAADRQPQAQADVLELLAKNHDHPRLPHAVHEIVEEAKKLDLTLQAGQICQNILASQPNHPQAIWLKMGVAIANAYMGNDSAVDSTLRNIIAQHAGDDRAAEALGQTAWAYRKLDKNAQARNVYQYVVDNWPDKDRAIFSQRGLVLCSIALDDDAGAEVALQKLFAEYEGNKYMAEIVRNIAGAYSKKGKANEAVTLHQYVVDKHPESPEALWCQRDMIIYDIDAGDGQAVEAALQKLVTGFAGRTQLPEALAGIGEHYRRRGNLQNARQIHQTIIDKWPQTEHAVTSQTAVTEIDILLLVQSGKEQEVQQALSNLIATYRTDPALPRILAHVGDQYQRVGKYENAEALYRQVIDIVPLTERAADVQGAIGWTYVKRELYDQAAREYGKVVEIYPKSNWAPNGQFWVAQCYYKKGDLEQAVAEYQKVIEMYPDSKQAGFARRRIAVIQDMQDHAVPPRPEMNQSETGQISADCSCGPSALVVLAGLLGVSLDGQEMTQLAGTDEQGLTSMYGLAQAARAKGLKATGMKLSFEDLNKLGKPVIAFVGGTHFTVIKRAGKTDVVEANKKGGETVISQEDFCRTWDGYVLILEKTA